MSQPQPFGVQGMTSQPEGSLPWCLPELTSRLVEPVSDEWVSDRREMHTNLMVPARSWTAPQKGCTRPAIQRPVVRDRRPRLRRVRLAGHQRPLLPRGMSDWRVDCSGICTNDSVDEGEVRLHSFALFELLLQPAMRDAVPGNRDDAAGFGVQSVHDARSSQSACHGPFVSNSLESVQERVVLMRTGRMDNHPGVLIHQSAPGVVVQPVDRTRCGRRVHVRRIDQTHGDDVTGNDPAVCRRLARVNLNAAATNESLQPPRGVIPQKGSQRGVDPLSGPLGRDRERDRRLIELAHGRTTGLVTKSW